MNEPESTNADNSSPHLPRRWLPVALYTRRLLDLFELLH